MKSIHIRNIEEAYNLLSMGSPIHPLVTVMRETNSPVNIDLEQIEFSSDLYYIIFKKGISGKLTYGRSSYDYKDGTLIFIGPGQTATFKNPSVEDPNLGWSILFDPALIRKSELGKALKDYDYFNYSKNEALHLSHEEMTFLNIVIDKLEQEINANYDRFSHDLIIQHLATFLKYSQRYYDRQFYTRTDKNNDLLSKFEHFLFNYFNSEKLETDGIPSVNVCGNHLGMTGHYLSNMLKAQTQRNAKDYIYSYFIRHAKLELVGSKKSISQIAYQFGFDYPQHFSKLFKSKTGHSPSEFRNLN